MKVSQAAAAATRLAVVNDKAQAALSKMLASWFSAQFVKSMSLPLLRSVHQAGAYPAFAELLSSATDADRIAVLKKLDKQRQDLLIKTKLEMLNHVEALASGRIEPAKPAGKKGGSSGSAKPGRSKKAVGIISTSKY